MTDEYVKERNAEMVSFEEHVLNKKNAWINPELIEGYKEMSRINLSLAEDAVQSDNDALMLGEQKLAECE